MRNYNTNTNTKKIETSTFPHKKNPSIMKVCSSFSYGFAESLGLCKAKKTEKEVARMYDSIGRRLYDITR